MSFPEVFHESSGASDDAVIEVGRLRVVPHEFLATFEGEPMQLTHKEFRLLTMFARMPGRVMHRERIAEEVWGGAAPGRTIDIHVSRLRRRLPRGAIETVIRVGYRFVLTE